VKREEEREVQGGIPSHHTTRLYTVYGQPFSTFLSRIHPAGSPRLKQSPLPDLHDRSPAEEVLGSSIGDLRGWETFLLFRVLKVSLFLCPEQEKHLLSAVRNGQRSDSDRASPY